MFGQKGFQIGAPETHEVADLHERNATLGNHPPYMPFARGQELRGFDNGEKCVLVCHGR